jgi:drug/metabolite transporter (DMT)-like permease
MKWAGSITSLIILCTLSLVVYNLIWKYLAKDLSPKVMIIMLYGVSFLVAWLVVGTTLDKSARSQLSRKHILLLVIAWTSIYAFQYTSALSAKTAFSFGSFRTITTTLYIALLVFCEWYFFGDKITTNQLIGCALGFAWVYFLMK